MSSPNYHPTPRLKIGSRGSPLAFQQVLEVISLWNTAGCVVEYDHIPYLTRGDRDKTTSLSSQPADNFFTDTLDQALLNGEIDLAIHSAKDLPKNLPIGLQILALTPCLDETDCFISHAPLKDLKPESKIGTSSQPRAQTIHKLYPTLHCVNIRGTIEERIKLFQDGKVDGIIAATCAIKRLKLDSLITEILPWESTPLQGQLAIVGRDNSNESLFNLCAKIDVRRKYGQVTLVGAGPGDPELITLKAIKALKTADCIFYDYLINTDILAHAPMAQKIYAGRRKGDHTMPQSELSRLLRKYAQQGKNVLRLKGGDPLIFGRGAEEIAYLRDYHIQVHVIPGVSSATGIPSSLGIPLTARGISSSVTFLSAHSEADLTSPTQNLSIPTSGTIIFFMGLTKLNVIVQSLLEAGWKPDTPIAAISKGTMKEQTVIKATVASIEKAISQSPLAPPVLLIVGKTVEFCDPAQLSFLTDEALAQRDADSKTKMLATKKLFPSPMLYLGTNPQKYSQLGEIIHIPLLEITAKSFSAEEKKRLISQLDQWEMIIFTSQFGVQFFFKILEDGGGLIDILRRIPCVAIGHETEKHLRSKGIIPALTSTVETSQGLCAQILARFDVSGKKILFPRSNLPNSYLKTELQRAGAHVTELIVYENKKNQNASELLGISEAQIRTVIFTSPSTLKNFLETYGRIPTQWKILSRGSLTGKALRDNGYVSEELNDESIS